MTTQYETERSQRLIIMLDAGRMMMTRIGISRASIRP